jgi:hypothetical protein
MAKILVSGLIYVETTLRVEEFPIVHNPVNFPFLGINSSVSGVGYNIPMAFGALSDEVNFLSLIGADSEGQLVQSALAADGIPAEGVLESIPATPNWSFPPASWSAPSAATPFSRPSCTAKSNPGPLSEPAQGNGVRFL